MTDTVHVHEKPQSHERCAFCHDGFEDESGKGMVRAECATCGAPHHATCFVENARCAVMGCNGDATRRLGGLEERISLPDLARRIGAQVDVPIPPGVRLEELRRMRRAALVIVGFVLLTVLLGLGSTIKRFDFLLALLGWSVGVGGSVALLYGWVYWWRHRLDAERTLSEERTGPPCPRCGEPYQLASDGTPFCYRCDGGPAES